MTGSYEAEDALHASLVYVLDEAQGLAGLSVVEAGGIELDAFGVAGYLVDFFLTEALAQEEENVAIQAGVFLDPEWVAVPCCVFQPDPNDQTRRRVQILYFDGSILPADNIVQVSIQLYQFNRY